MKQINTNLTSLSIGLDIGDKRSVAVVLSPNGQVLEELKVASTQSGLARLARLDPNLLYPIQHRKLSSLLFGLWNSPREYKPLQDAGTSKVSQS